MAKARNYVAIDTAGRAENIKPEWDWFDILDWVSRTVGSAGGNTPLPDKLLLNGEIIVPADLHTMGWKYGQAQRYEYEQARQKVRAMFPDPTQETGHD